MKRVGLILQDALTEVPNSQTLTASNSDAEFEPLPEITGDTVTIEQVSEPKKNRKTKKAEAVNEQDSDG